MNSALNPEAPEFYPHLKTVTQGGYLKVNNTIKSSHLLPTGVSYDLFNTFSNFNVIKYKLKENVVEQSNKIITEEVPKVNLRFKDDNHNTDKITDANDHVLDRVNINIDTISGMSKPADRFLQGIKGNSNISSWNNTPVVSKVKVGSTSLIGAKNITRPQLMFKDTIDNSESLWVPKIADKPNNIKPLTLNILYNNEGEAVGYEHPYKLELDLYQPPSQFIDPDSEPPIFPPKLEDTKLTYIDTEAQLDDLVEHLLTVAEIAVDVEHHAYRSYQGILFCDHLHHINMSYTRPDFGVYLVGLFDTHRAARMLNLSKLSLKYLLTRYCNVNTDKSQQLADWRIRPLPDELIQYARMDTHYLLYIWRMMKSELLEKDSGYAHLLLAVFEQSRQICGATYNKEVIHEGSHMQLYLHSKKNFNTRQLAALKMLYKWRDTHARDLDESTVYLLPNHMMLSLAEILPREVQGVNACCNPMPPFVKQNLISIHRMILSCREIPIEPQLYQMPRSIRSIVSLQQSTTPSSKHDLLHFPDVVDGDEHINVDQTYAEFDELEMAVKPFTAEPNNNDDPPQFVSVLNAEAKLFIPPYDRYRKYRSLAQLEEIKEYKDKEAKIAAISKGNELIKEEVLTKLQETKEQLEKCEEGAQTKSTANVNEPKLEKFTAQRKRKLPEKGEQNDNTQKERQDKNEFNKSVKKVENFKPFHYKNSNYKKFHDETAKSFKKMTKVNKQK
ncbi:hypothetical protein K1T71_000513 [Dendrolimus kikuchii]|uniref:Uncharacterized protein n=1 Tax=Dendrolimus kikuchii TaxID=765133 RepID=A0ACC1DJX5_9NEOP|nr:hypothetical protein K1T71_000513 [Dendrolimus kikuchii]